LIESIDWLNNVPMNRLTYCFDPNFAVKNYFERRPLGNGQIDVFLNNRLGSFC